MSDHSGADPLGICRGCGGRILWTTTAHGRRLPVDRRPAETGNVQLTRGSDGITADVLGEQAAARARDAGQVSLYMPHWVTCPSPPARKKGRNPGRQA